MIVLLDQSKSLLSLYTEEGLKQIPFSDVGDIDSYIGGKTVFYITDAMEVDGAQIVDLVCKMTGQQVISDTEGGNLYIHSCNDKTVFVPDANIKFKGKYDCIPYDESMQTLVDSSLLLQNLIKKGAIAIIGERSRRFLMREAKGKRKEVLERQSKRDQALDGILVDGTVDDYIESGLIASHNPKDVMTIDMSNDHGGGQTMTDLLAEIEGE